MLPTSWYPGMGIRVHVWFLILCVDVLVYSVPFAALVLLLCVAFPPEGCPCLHGYPSFPHNVASQKALGEEAHWEH